ncbi:MAG: RtcB family protein [Pirellulales bacterium]
MSDASRTAAQRQWLVEPLPTDVARSLARLSAAADVRHVAVMPDVHLSGEVCVGVAVAAERLIYPAAVGSDIGCGMAAIGFATDAKLLADEQVAARLLAGLYGRIPSLKHRPATVPAALPAALAAVPLSSPRLEKLKSRDGRWQFGTLGRGNHFVELQADRDDQLWLMIHSGSRGMGQAITAHHVAAAAKASNAGGQKLLALEAESPAGQAYLADASWAIEYAMQNRLAMIDAVAELLESCCGVAARRDTLIHSNHNHVRRETHFGRELWVHRKGALSAADGEPGVIPGSMGSASFHVVGRGCADALCSSSHGAGRAMSRSEASRAIGARQLERELRGVWFDHRQAQRLRDEAPSAYKDIHAVLRAERELTCITRELRPLLSYKGV